MNTLGEEQTLASGAKLRIQVAPFAVSKALFQALLREVRNLDTVTVSDVEGILLRSFAIGLSSQSVENALWACFERCTYNGAKIDKDTFEPVEARDDYIKVCVEVAKANVLPFTKSLFATWKTGVLTAASVLASELKETTA